MSRRRCLTLTSMFKIWMFCVFTSILTFALIHLHRGFRSYDQNPELGQKDSQTPELSQKDSQTPELSQKDSQTPELSQKDSQAIKVMRRVENRDVFQAQKLMKDNATRWIVLDAIGSNCSHGIGLSTLEKWRTIVVTENNLVIKDCLLPQCQLLSSANFYELLGHLSTSKISRHPSITSGYLLALSRGATSIFDAKCTNGIFDLYTELDVTTSGQAGYLMYNDTNLFNPFEHSDITGCGVGRPCWDLYSAAISSRVNKTDTRRLFLKEFLELSVVQFVNYDIACAESMNKGSKSWSPTVVLGPGTLFPLETGSTLFHNEAVQWMFLPIAVPKWFSEIFRILTIHAVKKSLPLNVAFRSALNKQSEKVNPRFCPFGDVPAEIDYIRVFSCVDNARCRQGDSSVVCGIQLVRKVFKCMNPYVHLVNKTSVMLNTFFNAWMEDYQKLTAGRQRTSNHATTDSSVEVRLGFREHIWKYSTTSIVQHIYGPVRQLCRHLKMNVSSVWEDWKHPVIEDVALVIVVDEENLLTTIPYLEFVHRKYFRHIVYCGHSIIRFHEFLQATGLDHISYVTGMTNGEHCTYQCIAEAMKVGLPVRGYLLIMDTVLLNPWKLVNLPRDNVWMPQGFSKVNTYKTKSLAHWMNWNEKSDRKSMISIFEELREAGIGNYRFSQGASRTSSFKEFSEKFLKRFSSNLDSENVLFRPLELFYFPESLRDDYTMATKLFLRYNASTDMAVSVMSFGLSGHDEIVYIRGSSLNGENSKHPWFYFSEEISYFVNPFNLTKQLSTKLGRQFYCGKYLTDFEDSLKSLRRT